MAAEISERLMKYSLRVLAYRKFKFTERLYDKKVNEYSGSGSKIDQHLLPAQLAEIVLIMDEAYFEYASHL